MKNYEVKSGNRKRCIFLDNFICPQFAFGFPAGSYYSASLGAQMVKVPAYSAGDLGLIPGLGRFSGEGNGPTPVLLPRKSHGRRSLVSMESQRVRHKETWVLSLGQGRSTPVFLLGQYHGQSSVAGYSPWGCKELDTTEWLSTWIYINYI